MTTLKDHIGGRSMKDALSTLRADLVGYTVQFARGSTQGSKHVALVALDRYGRRVACARISRARAPQLASFTAC